MQNPLLNPYLSLPPTSTYFYVPFYSKIQRSFANMLPPLPELHFICQHTLIWFQSPQATKIALVKGVDDFHVDKAMGMFSLILVSLSALLHVVNSFIFLPRLQ